jgi:uncharacterized membrane protein
MHLAGNKVEAQHRADRIRLFRDELDQIERDGVLGLTPEQRARLDAYLDRTLADLARRFDIDTTETQRQVSWGMRIASTIGALALGAAVYLFFYRFWGFLSTTLQVVILVVTPVVLVLAARATARRERTLYFTALLSLVAFAAFILNLNVLASIFNVTPAPTAFLVWAAFALMLAYEYRLRLLLTAGLVSAVIFAAAVTAAAAGIHWEAFAENPENVIPAGLLVFGAPRMLRHREFTEFPPIYRLLGLVVVFLAVFLLSIHGEPSYLFLQPRHVESFYQAAGLASAALAVWTGVKWRLDEVAIVGIGFFILFLYARFVDWWWEWMPKYLFFLVVGLISIALLVLLQRLRRRLKEKPA